MSTKAQITTAIDTKIRNKTPLVVKIEHADVEQLITNEQFPASVKVEWDGTTSIDPTTDIVCFAIPTDNIKFKIYFWKQGNTVYFNGTLESLNSSSSLPFLTLVTFPTNLYKPLTTSCIRTPTISSYGNIGGIQQLGKHNIGVTDTLGGKMYVTSGTPANADGLYWEFNGTYKVAN